MYATKLLTATALLKATNKQTNKLTSLSLDHLHLFVEGKVKCTSQNFCQNDT